MFRQKLFFAFVQIFITTSLFIAAPAVHAAGSVSKSVSGGDIYFTTSRPHAGATITVQGPNGYFFEGRGASVSSLGIEVGLEDGIYHYEVTLEPTLKKTRKNDREDTMVNRRTPGNISSGSFTVENGLIVNPNVQEATGG